MKFDHLFVVHCVDNVYEKTFSWNLDLFGYVFSEDIEDTRDCQLLLMFIQELMYNSNSHTII